MKTTFKRKTVMAATIVIGAITMIPLFISILYAGGTL